MGIGKVKPGIIGSAHPHDNGPPRVIRPKCREVGRAILSNQANGTARTLRLSSVREGLAVDEVRLARRPRQATVAGASAFLVVSSALLLAPPAVGFVSGSTPFSHGARVSLGAPNTGTLQATGTRRATGMLRPTSVARARELLARSPGVGHAGGHVRARDDANRLAPFERAKVAGQVATTALANLPTQAEAGAVMGSSFVEVAGYFVSPKVASAGALPGLKSRVVGEYVGRNGSGFLGVTIAEYSSPSSAAKAMRVEAKDVGVRLKGTGKGLAGPSPWESFSTWVGTTPEGDAGMAFAIAGPVLMRMTLSPTKGPWSEVQWERAWGEVRALQQRLMAQGAVLAPPAYLAGLVPAASPTRLDPVAVGMRSRDGWLPGGRLSTGLYQSMRPLNLTLQYAIAGAAPELLLQVVIAPTSNPALAQEFVSSLRSDPDSVGEYPIEGLPTGAVTVSYQGETAIDSIRTQFVGDGTLVDITCSGITLASEVQPALDECARATFELGKAFGR